MQDISPNHSPSPHAFLMHLVATHMKIDSILVENEEKQRLER
jgi:hypothetical protein